MNAHGENPIQFCKCPICGFEFQRRVRDPAAWYREKFPEHKVGDVLPALCFWHWRDATDEAKGKWVFGMAPRAKDLPKRDVDEIVARVTQRFPTVKVDQHVVKYPHDDDGLWWFHLPGVSKKSIQIESSYGMCPFLVEQCDIPSLPERDWAHSVEEAVDKVVAYLSGIQ